VDRGPKQVLQNCVRRPQGLMERPYATHPLNVLHLQLCISLIAMKGFVTSQHAACT